MEKRKASESFGKGQKVKMSFRQFVEQLEAGNEDLYLTTQEVRLASSRA